jgi:hypothetical protein
MPRERVLESIQSTKSDFGPGLGDHNHEELDDKHDEPLVFHDFDYIAA